MGSVCCMRVYVLSVKRSDDEKRCRGAAVERMHTHAQPARHQIDSIDRRGFCVGPLLWLWPLAWSKRKAQQQSEGNIPSLGEKGRPSLFSPASRLPPLSRLFSAHLLRSVGCTSVHADISLPLASRSIADQYTHSRQKKEPPAPRPLKKQLQQDTHACQQAADYKDDKSEPHLYASIPQTRF